MTRKVLWSGGFDSTWHVLRLLSAGVTVDAIYLVQDETWQKQQREVEAQDRIMARLPYAWRSRLSRTMESSDELWRAYGDLSSRWPVETSGQDPMFAAVQRVCQDTDVCLVVDDRVSSLREMALRDSRVPLPTFGLTKQAMLTEARHARWDRFLDWTWSCEGWNSEATQGPCGLCLPCRLRIIAAPTVAPVESWT